MWNRLTSSIGAFAQSSKKLQAHIDFASLAVPLLLTHEAIASGRCCEADWQQNQQAEYLAWRTRELGAAIVCANDAMTLQLAELLGHVAELDSGDAPLPAAPPLLEEGEGRTSAAFSPVVGPSSHTNPSPTLRFQMKALHAEDARAAETRYRTHCTQRAGFSLWLGPSQAPTPGHSAGLYLQGRALPGSVVGLYPGVVFNGEMRRRPGDAGHLGNPAFERRLLPRFDEALIDVSQPRPEGRDNPYALAQHARHPPVGFLPNVMRLQVDFMASRTERGQPAGDDLLPFPAHLRDYIPNAWGADVSVGQQLYAGLEAGIWMKGMALIALRPLWSEELFVDWSLDPSGPLPAWYHELKPAAARRVWKGITG